MGARDGLQGYASNARGPSHFLQSRSGGSRPSCCARPHRTAPDSGPAARRRPKNKDTTRSSRAGGRWRALRRVPPRAAGPYGDSDSDTTGRRVGCECPDVASHRRLSRNHASPPRRRPLHVRGRACAPPASVAPLRGPMSGPASPVCPWPRCSALLCAASVLPCARRAALPAATARPWRFSLPGVRRRRRSRAVHA
jgi:hypothetical protein